MADINDKDSSDMESKRQRNPEDVADILGKLGRWQITLMMGVVYINIPAAWYNLGMAFLAPKVDHWCARPLQLRNVSVREWKNMSIPYVEEHGEIVYDQCKMYDVLSNTSSLVKENMSEIPCHSWEYDHSFYKSTIVEEWDLVCERSWLSSLATSLYFAGFLITVFVGGQLSDRFGRKPTLFACIAWTFIFGIVCMLASNFWVFGICRFFLSLGRASTFLIVYVLLMEIVGKEHRITVGLFDKLGWSLGQMILPGIVWLFRDWFYLELISALPYVIILPLWWSVPESPRWLLSRGRIDEAEVIIKNAEKMNNLKIVNLREKLERIAKRNLEESQRSGCKEITFIDLMKTHNLRLLSFILYCIWVANVLAYYGLSFTAADIGGDVLLFFFLSAVVELPAGLAYFYLQPRLGRRKTQISSMMMTGIACLLAIGVPKHLAPIRTTLAVISKFGLSISFTSMYLLSTEIYPTVVRNVGLGSCSMMGRFGAIIAPFMKEAGESVHWSFPMAIFGVLSIVGGLSVLLLPETKDINLTDTLVQGETLGSHALHILGRRKSEISEDHNGRNTAV